MLVSKDAVEFLAENPQLNAGTIMPDISKKNCLDVHDCLVEFVCSGHIELSAKYFAQLESNTPEVSCVPDNST
jgi:hypothetical protein